MAENRGKQFESKFKADFLKSPEVSLDRLYDPTGLYMGIRNICDYIGYHYPNIFYIELKSSHGNTWPFSAYSQFDKMLPKVGIKGVRVGVVLWMIDHNKVIYLPTRTIATMKAENKKSFNIKDLTSGKYRIFEIPSKKKRVFMDSDYSVMFDLEEGD